MPPAETGECVVLCPLEFERRAVERALAAGPATVPHRILRTGPGPNRIREAVAGLVTVHGKPSLVILAGVAGGLDPQSRTAAAPVVERVTDLSGNEWLCHLALGNGGDADRGPESSAGKATILGVDQPVLTPQAKSDLHQRTGAAVVDTESHEFARACEAAGLRWAVVRGVSDGPTDTLPSQAAAWVSEDGLTRPWRVAATLAWHPWQVGRIARLGRHSSRAMRTVGERIVELLREEQARAGRAAAPAGTASS